MKIFIVEDAQNIRNNLKKFILDINKLELAGEADNAETAIRLINEINPDIILLDIELKSGSGLEVLKYVKSGNYPFKPTVILFSNYINLYKDKSILSKADYLYDKSADLDKLLSTLTELCL